MKVIKKNAQTIIGGIVNALLISDLVLDIIRKHFKTSSTDKTN
jgi:hypothetical protein